MLTPMFYADADTDSQADVPPASGGRADGEAWRAAGGGKEAAAVHLQEGRCRLCHLSKVSLANLSHSIFIFYPVQVPGPTHGGAVWRVHQGEDPVDRGDEAAVRAGQGRGGVDQVPQGVHRQQRHDHLILIRAISSDSRSHCWKVTALLVNGLDSKFWQKLPRLWESLAISTDCGWTLMGESNAQRIKWWKMWIYNTNQTFFCFAYMCHLWTAVTGRSLVLFWS